MERTTWRVCRREGCQRALSGFQQIAGFCDANCFSMHDEERELHMRKAEEFMEVQNRYFAGTINFTEVY